MHRGCVAGQAQMPSEFGSQTSDKLGLSSRARPTANGMERANNAGEELASS
jgi:hypothetical protein